MLRRNTVLEINRRERFTTPLIRFRASLPSNWQEHRSQIRSAASADFFQQPAGPRGNSFVTARDHRRLLLAREKPRVTQGI
jgi:hypothetical protein